MKTPVRSCGFTLLELLVAMAVTASVGVIAWQFLDSALQVSARSETVLDEVDTFEQFWQLLEMDLQQSRSPFRFAEQEVPPQTRALAEFAGGEALQDMARSLPATGGEQPWLLLVRDEGSRPLAGATSGLQRVLYTLRDGVLLRHTWVERNLERLRPQVSRRVLARGVNGLQIRFLAGVDSNPGGAWESRWPAAAWSNEGNLQQSAGPGSTLPLAVTLTLQTEALGDVERIFTLPGV